MDETQPPGEDKKGNVLG